MTLQESRMYHMMKKEQVSDEILLAVQELNKAKGSYGFHLEEIPRMELSVQALEVKDIMSKYLKNILPEDIMDTKTSEISGARIWLSQSVLTDNAYGHYPTNRYYLCIDFPGEVEPVKAEVIPDATEYLLASLKGKSNNGISYTNPGLFGTEYFAEEIEALGMDKNAFSSIVKNSFNIYELNEIKEESRPYFSPEALRDIWDIDHSRPDWVTEEEWEKILNENPVLFKDVIMTEASASEENKKIIPEIKTAQETVSPNHENHMIYMEIEDNGRICKGYDLNLPPALMTPQNNFGLTDKKHELFFLESTDKVKARRDILQAAFGGRIKEIHIESLCPPKDNEAYAKALDSEALTEQEYAGILQEQEQVLTSVSEDAALEEAGPLEEEMEADTSEDIEL